MVENLEDLKNKYISLNDNYKNLEKLLEAYNPWTDKNISKLSEDFFAALKNEDKDFSWLNVDEDLYEELKDKEEKAVSIDYGIPSHVRGDIEKGTVFLCLVNPNIDVKVAMCEACQMKNKEEIKNYIFDSSSEGGILYKEIVELKGMKNLIGLEESDEDKNQEKNKIGYYTANYFYVILSAINDYKNKDERKSNDLKEAVKSFRIFTSNLEENDDKKPTNEENINIEDLKNFVKISKKIVNLEAFPFRSSSPQFAKKGNKNAGKRFANCLVKSNSKVSMLSSRIIIWKILEYINNPKDKVKPVFIIRRFNRAWRPSITNVLIEDFRIKDDKDINNIINELHKEYFYTLGRLDNDNFSKMKKNNLYKNDVKILENEEEGNFNKRIFDALISQKTIRKIKLYE
ncbi:MAG: hypothetical protein KIA06_04915 [Finegoldia magna]|uniref:hypothetical protein n=1 Tax=Finegoldia magna TaxID=1260 RepID=UPI0026F35877|nr:hypothetical protein [Finegoldia magna]MBS5966790.1 hypothetical protein [Finegoldia magna]